MSLRQDILDELTDHLQCALRRELLSHPFDAASARDRVLARFGDPAAVARQLFIDALKESRMSHRILIAAVLVLALLTTGTVLYVWQSQATALAQLERQQTSLQQLVAQLSALVDRSLSDAPPVAPSEWNRLKVHFVWDHAGGEGAAGVASVLTEKSKTPYGLPPLSETSDAQGWIDFGQIRFGLYQLDVQVGETFSLLRYVEMYPGRDREIEVVCPRPGTTVPVRITRASDESLPPEIAQRLWTTYRFERSSSGTPDRWEGLPSGSNLYITLRPDGRCLVTQDGDSADGWVAHEDLSGEDDPTLPYVVRSAYVRSRFAPETPWSDVARIPPGTYRVAALSESIADDADPSGNTILTGVVLAGEFSKRDYKQKTSHLAFDSLLFSTDVPFLRGGGAYETYEYDYRAGQIMVAALNSANEWRLAHPSRLWRQYHVVLKVPPGHEVFQLPVGLDNGLPSNWKQLNEHPYLEVLVRDTETGRLVTLLSSVQLLSLGEVAPSEPLLRRPTRPGTHGQTIFPLLVFPEERPILDKALRLAAISVRPTETQPQNDPDRMNPTVAARIAAAELVNRNVGRFAATALEQ